MRHSLIIEIQTVPFLEQIEQRDGKGEPHLEICPNSLPQMLQFTNLRQQRKDGFDQHSLVPFAAPADFQIFRLVDAPPKTGVRQHDHLRGNSFDERQKFLIGNIRRFYLPIGNESEFIRQQAKLAADNPFPRSKAFLADTFPLGLMIFTNRMTQLNAVRINHAENRRLSQKLIRQLAMCFQAAKESGSFRQSRKKFKPILFDPSIKLVLRSAFQSKQQSKSDKFAQRKLGLNMLRRLLQHIVYTAKKFCDKVFLSHGIAFLFVWFGHQYSRNFSVTFSTSTNG